MSATAEVPVDDKQDNGPISVHDDVIDAVRTFDSGFASRNYNEAVQHYLVRVIKTLSRVEENVYESLSPEAKAWNEEAVAAFKASKPLPQIPGMDEAFEKNEAVRKERQRKPARNPRTEKVVDPETGNKEVRRKPGAGVTNIYRKMIVQNYQTSNRELMLRLKAEYPEVNTSTMSIVYSDTQSTLREAIEAGWTPPK